MAHPRVRRLTPQWLRRKLGLDKDDVAEFVRMVSQKKETQKGAARKDAPRVVKVRSPPSFALLTCLLVLRRSQSVCKCCLVRRGSTLSILNPAVTTRIRAQSQ